MTVCYIQAAEVLRLGNAPSLPRPPRLQSLATKQELAVLKHFSTN